MKKQSVYIEGVELFFETEALGEYLEYVVTHFYKETRTVTYRKWWLFGEILTKEEPVVFFTIYRDIFDPRLSSDWWRAEITKRLNVEKRIKELEQGKFI